MGRNYETSHYAKERQTASRVKSEMIEIPRSVLERFINAIGYGA